MVLVSNEWRNNKDDEQKSPTPASPTATATTTTTTTTTASEAPAAAAAGLLGSGITLGPGTVGVSVGGGVGGAGAGAGSGSGSGGVAKRKKQNSNNNNMETNKKQTAAEQDKLLQILKTEKHELETAATDLIESNENQENNTLQGHGHLLTNSSPDIHSTIIPTNTTGGTINSPQQQHQVLNMALNSVINGGGGGVSGEGGVMGVGGTAGVVPLFGTLSGLNNGALLQRDSIELQQNLSSTVTNELDNDTSRCSMGTTKGEAKIVLQCEAKSHKFETRTILLQPNQECKVGRLIAKSKASEGNAIFDCKVLSRNHAMLWYSPDGHFWVKDTKSSNGTFINDNKLGNDPAELYYGDIVKFGVEVIENSRQEVHGCIIARVTLFLPDGREAISIESDQMQLVGPNRISFEEIQRLNSFLQEASQREKMLKAKLNSLQGVLDSTRKNSAMCWQSMITEDQLLQKINLLEKKLQIMEKNVPENALRNEIVKLLEDKTTYQLTAKEALRKVYQERCDAMQMFSKMELAYATSENESSLLRSQILTSKQTLQDYDTRLEQLQQEYTEYKQETLRQQQEAKEQEEKRMEQLKEQLGTQEREMEELRMELKILQQTIAEHDSEQKLQEQSALEQLDAAITDNMDEDDDDDDDDDDEDDDEDMEQREKSKSIEEKDSDTKQEPVDGETVDHITTPPGKQKKSKKSKHDKLDIKNKVIRKSAVMNWLKNSDLNKGEGGSDIMKAIFNSEDSGDEENRTNKDDVPKKTNIINREGDGAVESEVSDEFIHNSPKSQQQRRLNGSHKLETQETLVRSAIHDLDNSFTDPDLPEEQAIEMLQEECETYKQKTTVLMQEIQELQNQVDALREELATEKQSKTTILESEQQKELPVEKEQELNKLEDQRQVSGQEDGDCPNENEVSSWKEDLDAMRNAKMEQEEELIVYKERLEKSESSILLLKNEISQLMLKQQQAGLVQGNKLFINRILPLGCIALGVLVYFLLNRL